MGSKGISTNMSKETSRGTSRKHIHQLTLVHLLPSPNSVQLYKRLVSSVPVCHCFTFPPKWICTHQSFPLLRQPSLCHCGEVKAKHINACCSLFHCASFPPSNFSHYFSREASSLSFKCVFWWTQWDNIIQETNLLLPSMVHHFLSLTQQAYTPQFYCPLETPKVRGNRPQLENENAQAGE